jgi:hypothetical protein
MTLTRARPQLQATIAARDAFIKDLEDQARADAQERRKLHNMVQELKGAHSTRMHLKLYAISSLAPLLSFPWCDCVLSRQHPRVCARASLGGSRKRTAPPLHHSIENCFWL